MRLTKRTKRRLIVLGVVVATLSVGGLGFKAARNWQQGRLINAARESGMSAYAAGDYKRTLDESNLPYFVQYVRDDVEALMAFADARSRLPLPAGKHLLEAISYNKHSLKLLDADTSIDGRSDKIQTCLTRLLELYASVGLRFELKQIADRMLASDSAAVYPLSMKAMAHYVDREFNLAEILTKRLIELEPNSLEWRQLMIEVRRGRGDSREDILRLCDEWAQAAEGDARFDVLLAGVLAQMGELREATAIGKTIVERGAHSADVLGRAIGLLDGLGQHALADELVMRTRTEHPNEAWVREANVRRLWQVHRIEDALSEIALLEREFGVLTGRMERLKVAVLLGAGRTEEAIGAARRLAVDEGSSHEALSDRAWGMAVAQRWQQGATWAESEPVFRNAVLLNPNDAMAYYLFAEACAQAGESDRAISLYEDAFDRDPNWLVCGMKLGEELLRAGRTQKAHQVAERVLRRAPSELLSPYLLFARAHLALMRQGMEPSIHNGVTGETVRITDLLEQIHDAAPHEGTVMLLLAEAYMLSGSSAQGEQFMVRALREVTDQTILWRMADLARRYGVDVSGALQGAAGAIAAATLNDALDRGRLLAAVQDLEGAIRTVESSTGWERADAAERVLARRMVALWKSQAGRADAAASIEQLVKEDSSAQTLVFALALPQTWERTEFVRKVIDQLRQQVGDQSQHVRLAEANLIVRTEAGNEARLAHALRLINGVLEESPESLIGLTLMAEASLSGPRPSINRAVEHLERAARLYPGETALLVKLVELLQRKGDYDGAQQYLMQLGGSRTADEETRAAELRLLQSQGDAASALMRASALVGRSAPLRERLVLANLAARAGETQRAEAIYEQLLREAGDDMLVASAAAEFVAMQGNVMRGAAILEGAMTKSEPAARAASMASFFLRHGNMASAEAWLVRAGDARSAALQHVRSRLHLERGEFQLARQSALAGLKLDAGHESLRLTLAVSMLTGPGADRVEAAKVLREANMDASLTDLFDLLATVPQKHGENAPTPQNLKQALVLVEKHAEFLPAWMTAYSLHISARDFKQAVQIARRASARFRIHPDPPRWAAQALAQQGQYNDALLEAHAWRRRVQHNPLTADLMIASLLLQLDRATDAAAQLEPWQEHFVRDRASSESELALWLRSLVLSGQMERARRIMQPLLAESATWRSMWIGITHEMPANEALDALRAVDSYVTGTGLEHVQLAAAFSALGHRTGWTELFDRAELLAQQAATDAQFAQAAGLLRAAIAEGRGDLQSAQRMYRDVLKSDPRNLIAMNNLANLLVKLDHRDEALSLASKVVELQPENADYLDTYGRALRHARRGEAALEAFMRALSLRPSDAGITLQLAQTLLELGRQDEAERFLDDAARRLQHDRKVSERDRDLYQNLRQTLQRMTASAAP